MDNSLAGYVGYFITIIILLLVILFFIIVNSKIPSSFRTFSDVIEAHQGLIALTGIIAVIILFRIGQWIDNNNRKNEIKSRLHTACDILSLELTEYRAIFLITSA